MVEQFPITVEAVFKDCQPVLRLLEQNLDSEQVCLRWSEKPFRDKPSLDLRVTAASISILKQFLLVPMQHPADEMQDWSRQAVGLLVPGLELNFFFQVVKESIRIVAALKQDPLAISAIWVLTEKALDVVALEKRLDIVSLMRFMVPSPGKLAVISYRNEKPDRYVSVDINLAVHLPADQILNTYFDSVDHLGRWHKSASKKIASEGC